MMDFEKFEEFDMFTPIWLYISEIDTIHEKNWQKKK